ncbi:MAG: hypothetical protein GXO39_04340 [Thermotogae bacterium]|nr:hypothetical protein [Thermotogota bacterium]
MLRVTGANVVAVGGFHSDQVSVDFPTTTSRGVKATCPRVQVRGKGPWIDLHVRWEPIVAWRSRHYTALLPRIWEVVRKCYDADGCLKPDAQIPEGFAVIDGEGQVFLMDPMVLDFGPRASHPVIGCDDPSFEEGTIVLPRRLRPYWRPAVLIWRHEKREDMHLPLCNGYVRGWFTEKAAHHGRGSHWAPNKQCSIEFEPLPKEVTSPIELWKEEVAFEWEDWAHTPAGRWGDRLRLEVVSYDVGPCTWVIKGGYGYGKGGKAIPFERPEV